MTITSKVVKASPRSPSVRTTIPEDIVREASIQIGDVLEWKVINSDGKKSINIRKLE